MTKKMTLRQRLREDAARKLEAIGSTMNAAAERVADEHDTNIDMTEVMKMLANTQVGTLQQKLIGELANEAEVKLERLYNSQQDLTFGTKPEEKA